MIEALDCVPQHPNVLLPFPSLEGAFFRLSSASRDRRAELSPRFSHTPAKGELGGEGLGRKLVKVPPRKSFRQHGINYAAGQAHSKAAGRVSVLLCSAVF